MDISIIKSKKVCGPLRYLLGICWGEQQIRIGFILFHVVILFPAKRRR
jgi:hypothetical protein